jgi:GPI ethanolamine phosphate transferase membrane region
VFSQSSFKAATILILYNLFCHRFLILVTTTTIYEQVWRYLDAYAAAPGTAIPQADIAALHALLQSARASHSRHFVHKQQQQQQSAHKQPQQQQQQRTAHKQQQYVEADAALRQTCRLYRRFLDAAIGLGRRLWTQYDLVLMALGTAVQCAALLCISAKLLCVHRSRLLLVHGKQHSDNVGTAATTATTATVKSTYSSNSSSSSSTNSNSSASAEVARAVTGATAGAATGYIAVLTVPGVFSAPVEAVVALAAAGSSAAVASYWCNRCYCLLRPQRLARGVHSRITTTATATAAAAQHQKRSSSNSSSNNSSSSRQQVPSISGVWLCSTVLPVLVTVLYCCSVFSNSFIAAEHTLHLYLGSTLLLALVALAVQTQAQPRTSAVPLCCGALLFRLAAATLTADLPAAVNEDAATTAAGSGSGSSSAEHSLSMLRTVLPLAATWYLFARATRAAARAKSSALHAAQLLAVLCYWLCEAHASAEPAASVVAAVVHAVNAVLPAALQLRLLLPRAVYALSAAGVLSALCRPTALTATTARPTVFSVTRALVVAIAQHSSSVILLLTTPSLAYVVPSLLAAAALLIAGLSSLHTRQLPQLQLLLALVWALGTRAAFFFTGHHNQFSRLQYACAFIGFDDFDAAVGGSLLFVNTFGLEILGILALPLAAASISSSSRVSSSSSSSIEETVLAFAGLSAARTLLSTVNAVVQRRHLMLWAVFAPKFVFDAVMQAVVGASLVLMWAVVARASSAAVL